MKYYGIIAQKNIIISLAIIGFSPIITNTLNSKTLQQIQDLYKNIGNDLMYIRKEFTGAQPKIYSILDRVDKMYNLAKVTAEKKHLLSNQLKNQSNETKKLYTEIDTLKTKIATYEENLENSRKKLEITQNMLETAKNQTAQLSQEKAELYNKQSISNKINTDTNSNKKHQDARDIIHELKDLNGLSEEEKILLKQAQSLSLSSTSAPSSPR